MRALRHRPTRRTLRVRRTAAAPGPRERPACPALASTDARGYDFSSFRLTSARPGFSDAPDPPGQDLRHPERPRPQAGAAARRRGQRRRGRRARPLRRGAPGPDHRLPRTDRAGRAARRSARGGVRGGSGSRPARPRDAPLRRPAHRRHHVAPWQDRRDEDRRGQDPRRDAGRLPERPGGAGRPRRHRQRLPRPPRRRLDGAHLPLPGPERRRDPARHAGSRATRGVPLRRHLRHEQRVRVRLPPRQHEVRADAVRATGAPLRHRGRGRQHPDRRGAHAAHHLGSGPAVHRPLRRGRSDHPEAQAGGGHAGQRVGGAARGARAHGRLSQGRKAQDGLSHRDRHGEGGEAPRPPAPARRPVRPRQHAAPAPRQPGAPRATPSSSATSTTW